MIHQRTCLPLAIVLLLAQALSVEAEGADALRRYAFAEPHMGTTFRIVLYAPDEAKARKAAEAAFARIRQLDECMSDYRESSELMRLCKHPGLSPVAISDDLFTVLEKAQDLAKRSDGAFDVTVGPLSRLWRRSRRQKQLPSPERLAEARALVGHEKLSLDRSQRTATLLKNGMLLDLGGIAKGYAADEAQKVLRAHGVTSALVAAGGDIVVSEPPPDAPAWIVGIAPLDDPNRPPTKVLELNRAAVSTSGDAEQFVEIEGKRYSHILDPKTGLGLQGRQSVTVIASDGTTADSLATALNVLPPAKGLALVESTPGAAALIIHAGPQGETVTTSSRWPGTRPAQ